MIDADRCAGTLPRALTAARGASFAAAAMLRALLFSLALAAVGVPACASVETRALVLDGRSSAVDIYAPPAPARALAVIAHGFSRSRAQHVVLAMRLAEAGFLVAVPDLPSWTRHDSNARAIVALVGAIAAEHRLDTLPVVLIGTSAGGLAALLATEHVPRLALWIGLDPVDAFRQAKQVARKLHTPAAVLRAPGGACNVAGNARRIAAWLPQRPIERRIAGASHCDFEDTTDWRCEAICGHADATRQALIVTETVELARAAIAD
jgi:pimeloyl-ACP methyl ester carboxylesterase